MNIHLYMYSSESEWLLRYFNILFSVKTCIFVFSFLAKGSRKLRKHPLIQLCGVTLNQSTNHQSCNVSRFLCLATGTHTELEEGFRLRAVPFFSYRPSRAEQKKQAALSRGLFFLLRSRQTIVALLSTDYKKKKGLLVV